MAKTHSVHLICTIITNNKYGCVCEYWAQVNTQKHRNKDFKYKWTLWKIFSCTLASGRSRADPTWARARHNAEFEFISAGARDCKLFPLESGSGPRPARIMTESERFTVILHQNIPSDSPSGGRPWIKIVDYWQTRRFKARLPPEEWRWTEILMPIL